MTLGEAMERDILAVLPFGGKFLSIEDVTKSVVPRREPEVRKLLYALYKRRVLDLNRGGGGWPYLYGRRALRRI
jgi:hypothetical protein